MTEFVLVRHGETDWNNAGRLHGSIDIPLNETGISQALAVADLLGGDKWDVVVSSPLQRAFETAVQIMDRLGFETNDIIIDPRLRERFFGDAEGISLNERRTRWPDKVWPNAETPELMDTRTGGAIHDIAAQHAGKRIVLVAHGGWIRSVLRVVSENDPSIEDVVIPNASCSYVSHDGDSWQLGELGVAEHISLSD